MRGERVVRVVPDATSDWHEEVVGRSDHSWDLAVNHLLVKRGSSTVRSPEPQARAFDPFPTLHELASHHGALEILLLLDEEGSASKPRMRRTLRTGQVAIENSLRCLVQMGMVNCTSAKSFPFGESYRLTSRGRSLIESPLGSWSLDRV